MTSCLLQLQWRKFGGCGGTKAGLGHATRGLVCHERHRCWRRAHILLWCSQFRLAGPAPCALCLWLRSMPRIPAYKFGVTAPSTAKSRYKYKSMTPVSLRRWLWPVHHSKTQAILEAILKLTFHETGKLDGRAVGVTGSCSARWILWWSGQMPMPAKSCTQGSILLTLAGKVARQAGIQHEPWSHGWP